MPLAVELWRALEAWDPVAKRYRIDKGLPGAGRFAPGSGGVGHERPSLANAVKGTAAGGPKRQRKGGQSVADAVRAAARRSDTTGRPTQRSADEHRAHGAHDVADEVDLALRDAGVPDDVRELVAARARVAASKYGNRPDSLPRPEHMKPKPRASREEIQGDIHDAVRSLTAGRSSDDWVGLADLRDRLGGRHSREDVDKALIGMLDTEGVRIIPVANTKSLRPRDREAAVRIGGEDSHAISIRGDVARPGASSASTSPPSAPAPNRDAMKFTDADKLDAARQMYGDDESKWPKRAQADAAKIRARMAGETKPAAKSPAADAERSVRSAYDGLATEPGGWVSIADLRERMGGSREDQDRAIRDLIHRPGWQIEEETNQKALRPTDREGAIRIGGRDQHVISYSPPAAAAPKAKRARREFSQADAAAVGARLETAKSRDEARQHLADLTAQQLRQVATLLGVSARSKDTKPRLIDAIVQVAVGRRLDSDAIRRA